ncbi:MAG: hypothetical protein CMJ31_00050 [Phycisphaerae bacterium]|nr:hypothetical protein [Phycisphaerae bacterium]
MTRRAFSLIELLVVIAIIALLLGVLLAALGAARDSARTIACMSGVRQMGLAWTMYANDFDDRAMPLAYFESPDIEPGEDLVYWFGSDGRFSGHVDRSRGFITPYLDAALGENSIYECPSQPWGSYTPQTATSELTTTYGYNGYGLCPPKTPGWGGQWGPIGDRPWRRLSDVLRPSTLLAFADTLLPVGASGRSTALLDPPELFDPWSGSWSRNDAPTTSFRHGGEATVAVAVDGSAAARGAENGWVVAPEFGVGSIGTHAGPYYVEIADGWR